MKEIRVATTDDVPALARLTSSATDHPLEAERGKWARRLAAGGETDDQLVLVAETEQLIAFGRAWRMTWQECRVPENAAPEGWYLIGVLVEPAHRRQGWGLVLTRRRIDWIARRARELFYFVDPENQASIELHTSLGFQLISRDFAFPGIDSREARLLFRFGVDGGTGSAVRRRSSE